VGRRKANTIDWNERWGGGCDGLLGGRPRLSRYYSATST
jgi:hypothetical protein